MHKDNRKDISDKIEYTFMSFISSKLRVGVIGCGRAGTIKIKHFVNNNCYVEVIAKDFTEEIVELAKNSKNTLKLINDKFDFQFIKDKHIIILAVEDEELRKSIRELCEQDYKLYIDCADFTKGMGVIPVQRKTKNISFALNTKGGNPKGAVLAADKAKQVLAGYDDFIEFTTLIRNNAKNNPQYKREILNFIGSEEFKKAFDEGKEIEVLERNFTKEIVEFLIK